MPRTMKDIRANMAARKEDCRIARKHMEQAAERPFTCENKTAYDQAAKWFDTCCEAYRVARVEFIRADTHPFSPFSPFAPNSDGESNIRRDEL